MTGDGSYMVNRSFPNQVFEDDTARPRARVSALILGAAAVVLLASVSTSARAAEDPTRISHACGVVLGLDPSDLPYEDCVRSLEKTLSRLKQSELTASSRRQCAQKGLDPGTSAFDTCVVKAEAERF
jgi:hypothetical protein